MLQSSALESYLFAVVYSFHHKLKEGGVQQNDDFPMQQQQQQQQRWSGGVQTAGGVGLLLRGASVEGNCMSQMHLGKSAFPTSIKRGFS